MKPMTAIFIPLASGIFLVTIAQSPAFGQALGFDESRTFAIDNRRLSVTLEMRPLFITEDTQESTATIRLREVNTDATVPHVTYHVKIVRSGELLVDDRFHSHEGTLLFRFENADTKDELTGERESLYDAIIADRQNPVIIKGPLYGALYHYEISIISMREYDNRLAQPFYSNLYANIGQDFHHIVIDRDGNEHTLTIKTYYDQILDLEYDASTNAIIFTMPLEWDVEYLNRVPFIHEEVLIPLEFAELISNGYIGILNGMELSTREVMIDDYSYENTRTVHFVVTNDKLKRIALTQQPTENIAVFTLLPMETPKFPLEILSGREDFLLQVSWSPAVIEPDKPTKFIITIRDPVTLDTFRFGTADFVLLKDGREIFRQSHTAPIGAIVQDYTFTQDQTGSVLLLIENINNTGDSAPLLFTVVPEFPFGSLIAITAVTSMVIVATKIRTKLNSQLVGN